MNRQLWFVSRALVPVVAVVSLMAVLACSTSTTATTSRTGTTQPGTTSSLVPTSSVTSSPSPTSTVPAYTVNVASKPVIGNYLVDGRGMTLYYTVSDRPNYSNLPDETLTSWPAFYVPDISVPPTLNAADFGVYTRDNNVKQTTYGGYPLYYFFQDFKAGDTFGNKLGGVWFVIDPVNFPP